MTQLFDSRWLELLALILVWAINFVNRKTPDWWMQQNRWLRWLGYVLEAANVIILRVRKPQLTEPESEMRQRVREALGK